VTLKYGNVHAVEVMYIEFHQNLLSIRKIYVHVHIKFYLGPWVRGPKMACMRYTHISVIYNFHQMVAERTSKVCLYAKAVIIRCQEKSSMYL
jgi:hypothetical protein